MNFTHINSTAPTNPSCLQATSVFESLQKLLHTVPQLPFSNTSTRPMLLLVVLLPTSRSVPDAGSGLETREKDINIKERLDEDLVYIPSHITPAGEFEEHDSSFSSDCSTPEQSDTLLSFPKQPRPVHQTFSSGSISPNSDLDSDWRAPGNPSCLQTTVAPSKLQPLPHTAPHVPL